MTITFKTFWLLGAFAKVLAGKNAKFWHHGNRLEFQCLIVKPQLTRIQERTHVFIFLTSAHK